MPLISFKLLSGITSTILQQFIVITSFGPASTSLGLGSGNYTLLFGNVDGTISKDPVTPANASFGTYYYALAGGGVGGGGDPSVIVAGFDSVADEVVSLLFEAARGDGKYEISIPPIASGSTIDTLNWGFTLTPPVSDGITQTAAYDPAYFSFWLNLYTASEQFPLLGRKGGVFNESLLIDPGTSGIYFAVYVAQVKPATTSTGPVVGPIHLSSDCPALLANAATAQQVYGAAQSTATIGTGALTLLKNFAEAAELGAAPCKAAKI